MAGYTPDSLVTVRPFTHRVDGDTVILGDIDRQVFLAIPTEGLDILESLAAGRTVGETARSYEEKYAEKPDIEDFLEALEEEGFIGEAAAMEAGEVPEVRHAHWRWRMGWLSPRVARLLVSSPVLAVCGLVVLVGVALMVDDPTVVPKGGNALLFPIDFAALTWATILCALLGVAVHEVGHVVAARAAGVPAGIGVGNQLYVLVAQTDMTGIWLAPRRQRYVAFAIGAIIDAVSCAILAIFVWSAHRELIDPPRWTVLLATAVMLSYLTRISWQLFFFVRTDGYYIIATAFKCKNLMSDTEDYLRNLWARARRSSRRIDQSGIPPREMRVVRWFAPVWFFGRLVSIVVFCLTVVPVMWGYTYQFILWVVGGHTRFNSFDFATIAILTLGVEGGGLTMWLRGLYRGSQARRRREQARARRAERPQQATESAGVA